MDRRIALLCAVRRDGVDCTMSCTYGIPESKRNIRLAGGHLSVRLAVMYHKGRKILRNL